MRRGAIVLAVLALGADPVWAQDPAPGTPAWQAREAQNFADAHARATDYAAQPQEANPNGDGKRDPARWSPTRGAVLEATFGDAGPITLFRPRGVQARPLATVVLVPGDGSPRQNLYWLAEDLAEHGYLAAAFDAPPLEEAPVTGSEPALVVALATGGHVDHSDTAAFYSRNGPAFVTRTQAAVSWLTSGANPWRAWVDGRRIGVTGHSMGAYAAAQTANADVRLRAAVALDSYHPLDRGIGPRVPTAWLQSEQEIVLRTAPPANPEELHPTRAAYAAFRKAGIPSLFLVSRASTHADYVDGPVSASRDGQRVAAYTALAWFDRFLRGHRRGTARLFAKRYDASADVSSIGTGTLDAGGHNVPPAIAGETVADHLSFYYPSGLALFGAECTDIRLVACPRPAPLLNARLIHRRRHHALVGLRLVRGDTGRIRVHLAGRRGGRVTPRFRHEIRVRLRAPRGRLTLIARGGGLNARLPLLRP